MTPLFHKIRENRSYWAYKYRFGLQKGVKNQKYFFTFAKYDVAPFQRTFGRFRIFKIGGNNVH